jgi:hypothetical protein
MNLGGEVGTVPVSAVFASISSRSRSVLEGVDRPLTAHRIRAFGGDEQDCPWTPAIIDRNRFRKMNGYGSKPWDPLTAAQIPSRKEGEDERPGAHSVANHVGGPFTRGELVSGPYPGVTVPHVHRCFTTLWPDTCAEKPCGA